MFVSVAHAASAAAPSAGEAFMLNMLLIGILVIMFYVLLIMPQQKRFKQHREMMDALQKGDKVLLTSGFIGTIETMEETEVIVDLGNKVKVTVVRSAIQSKMDTPEEQKAERKATSRKGKKKEEEVEEEKEEIV